MDIKKFYEILFDNDEAVGFQFVAEPNEEGIPKYRKNFVLGRYGNLNCYYELFGSNPIEIDRDNCPDESKGHKPTEPRLADCNVSKIRTFVIEFDHQSLNEQTARMNKCKMPYSAKIYSGGKGYHFPISFETPFEDFDEAMRWKIATQRALARWGLDLDQSCFNPSRLTRSPGVLRVNTQQVQEIKELKGRVKNQDFLDWLLMNDCDPSKVELYERVEIEYTGPGNADDAERIQFVKNFANKYLGNYQTADNWNGYLYSVAQECKSVGLSEEVAIGFISQTYEYPDQKRLRQTVKNAYTYSKKSPKTININTPTPRSQEMETDVNIDDILNSSNEFQLPWDERIENYAWIGTKLYLIMPDGDLEEFTSSGFKARFGVRSNPVVDVTQRYSGFGYEPDYFKPNRRVGENLYNSFKLPKVKIEKGPWPYTKILLNHMFEDQLEMGLEYYWVKRHRPKQALPNLCFVGPEDGGKSTIGLHQKMCFANFSKINSTALEKDENAYAHQVQDIIIEESTSKGIGSYSNPDAIVDKIKDMVTACGFTLPIKKLYKNVADLEYYAKVMMFTNDVTPIKMSGQATRFWVREIKIPEKHENFLQRLEEEVGHFLWYLDNEFKPSRTSSRERLWFHPDEYHTKAKSTAMNDSQSRVYKIIKQNLIDWFNDVDQDECYFDLKSLLDYIQSQDNEKLSKSVIKDCLDKEFGFGESAERANVPDSLRGFFNSTTGQNDVKKRKMSYWRINRDFKIVRDEDGFPEKIEDYLNVEA